VRPVRILIADDHDVVRKGVRLVLETQPGWVVVGEASTGREAVAKAIELQPDVVILDISMPELNGLEATRQIRQAGTAAVLVVTMHDSDRMARSIIEAGASGYLSKAEAGRELVNAVRGILDPRTRKTEPQAAVSDGKTEAGMTEAGATRRLRRSRVLTPREREVLQLLAEGRSNKEIGVTLGITTKTAETHRAHVMAKLEVHSMSELVRYAIRNQVIEP
jgi:DNA-binding NarL/FixJ family response regulator